MTFHGSSVWTRWAAVLCSGLCFGASLSLGVAPSCADALLDMPIPYDVDAPEVAQLWINPDARAGENPNLGIDLLTVTPSPYRPGDPVTAQLRVTNNTDTALHHLVVVPRRAEASPSAIDSRTALTTPLESFSWVASETPVAETLAAGEHKDVTVQLESPFGVEAKGSYPIAFQATGTTSSGESLLNSERSVIAVDSAPEASIAEASQSSEETSEARIPGDAASALETTSGQPVPSATLIIPISARSPLTPGETGEAPNETPLLLSSESLADEIADGGRLDTLLDALEADTAHTDSRCLALDPDTLSTLDRMTRGYFVATQRAAIIDKRVRLRDRWFHRDDSQTAQEPGRGSEDAQHWLDRLKQQAAQTCTVPLTWAGADLHAVSATGDEWLARHALQEGQAVLEKILGRSPVERVVIPSSGYITPETLPILGWAAQPLSEEGMEADWEKSITEAQTAQQTPAAGSGPSQSTEPVRVLVADNTVWNADITTGEPHSVKEGITTYGYDASLAATLATTGAQPLTVGYSNPAARFDYTQDSAVARDLTAQTILLQALHAHNKLLIMPPSSLSGSTATMLLSTVGGMIDRGEARGTSLEQYLQPYAPSASDDAAEPQAQLESPGGRASEFGAPFPDPTKISDTEVVQAAQQATYVDELTRLLSNDSDIALRRYAFTAPLRRDILRSLSLGERGFYPNHDAWVDRMTDQLNATRDVLTSLRASVALIPPGNVYTLASPSSPLLVVAENRLPLPVVAKVGYQGIEGLTLSLPKSIRIPAAGSITTEITTVLPENHTSTQLSLWLTTRDGAAISQPVIVSVQTRPVGLGIVAAAVLLLGAGVTAVIHGRRKSS